MRPDLVQVLRCPVTGSPLRLTPQESIDDHVTYGTLQGATETYPILAGVAVLLPGLDEANEQVRTGNYADAAVAALWHQLPFTSRGRLAQALGLFGRTDALARSLERADQRRLYHALAPLLRTEATDPLALIRLGFEGWGPPNPDAVGYFTYRFGTPRHLVSLAVAEAVDLGPDALVLDLGCGAGHLTWGLAQLYGPGRTVSLDLSLFELWAARGVAGPVDLVCGDATALPLRTDAFGLVLSSDVLSFVHHKWGAAREAMRVVAPDGTIAVTAVKNALTDHVYAGSPLPPDGWRTLFEPLDHHLLADRQILEDYFAGERLSLSDGDAVDLRVDDSPTVTLLAGATGPRLKGRGRFDEWPHGVGPLGVNPLLRPTRSAADELVFRRRWPTERFAPDNPPIDSYLPSRLTVPASAVAGDELDRTEVGAHLASTAVLALPDRYRVGTLRPSGPSASPSRSVS